MKKRILISLKIVMVFVIAINATCCSSNKMTFDKEDFDVVLESDSHGGFMGEGIYTLVLDCTNNKEQALENIKEWKKLPLTKNLKVVAYGGELEGCTYSSFFSEDIEIPHIDNGYYYFRDRHSESVDSADDSKLYERYSYNFDFAIYDADNAMLYYLREDT